MQKFLAVLVMVIALCAPCFSRAATLSHMAIYIADGRGNLVLQPRAYAQEGGVYSDGFLIGYVAGNIIVDPAGNAIGVIEAVAE